MEIEWSDFVPAQLATDVLELFHPIANGKGLLLTLDAPRICTSPYRSDPGRIRQILLNLVGNALKFTQVGGVQIKLDVVQREGRDTLHARVLDTGPGIPETARDRLFGMFSQADASTARRFGGTGLGLAISKRLTEMLGGSIGFDSNGSRGTVFWVRIPLERLAPEDASLPDRKPEPSSPSSSLRILVAEDNPVNQKVAVGQLRKLGHRTEIAWNGADAVEQLVRQEFDLVFMDVQMPEVDGLEATRRIRAMERENGRRRATVIAMTANVMAGDRQACVEAGMDDFLAKPVSRQDLANMIARWDPLRVRDA